MFPEISLFWWQGVKSVRKRAAICLLHIVTRVKHTQGLSATKNHCRFALFALPHLLGCRVLGGSALLRGREKYVPEVRIIVRVLYSVGVHE